MQEAKSDGLFKSLDRLSGLSAFLLYLAEEGNDRLTINQATFLFMAATADLRGAPLTLSEIMALGQGTLTQSLKTTYKVLLEPTPSYRAGLGWIMREPDPNDERKKYLRLTKKGRHVIKEVLNTIEAQK